MATPAQRPPHVILVRVLLTAASLLAVLAIFAVWANRQALNADNWANTSSALLADPTIKHQLSDYLVDEAWSNVNVAGELQGALPPRLKPLAGPAAGGLRQVAGRATLTLLGRPRVEHLWKEANRVTAQQFINIAEGKSGAVGVRGNAVVLDLRVLVINLVQRLGLSGRLASKIPPQAGAITVLRSDQVKTLQNGVKLLRSLALVLPIVAFGLFGVALWLAAGRRRTTLLWIGIDIAAAGIVALLVRNLVGGYVVDALADNGPVRPAADATWSIGTDMLRDIAQAMIVGAIPLLLSAWVAGPSRPAVAIRLRLAPLLREHGGASYAVLGVVLLLIVAWGPIPATRKIIPMLIFSALAAVGLAALRRQTLEEFPPIAPVAGGVAPEPPVMPPKAPIAH